LYELQDHRGRNRLAYRTDAIQGAGVIQCFLLSVGFVEYRLALVYHQDGATVCVAPLLGIHVCVDLISQGILTFAGG